MLSIPHNFWNIESNYCDYVAIVKRTYGRKWGPIFWQTEYSKGLHVGILKLSKK